MSQRRSVLHRLALRVDQHLDRREEKRARALSADEIEIVPYRSYGTDALLTVSARVVRRSGRKRRVSDPTRIDNVVDAWTRIRSREVPSVELELRDHDQHLTISADAEGFVSFDFTPQRPVQSDALSWHEVELRVSGSDPAAPVHAFVPVLIPGTRAKFGIISDIGDTVIQTGATSLLRMARTLFLENAKTRVPFAGVAAFYRVLQEDSESVPINPLFYVSSSPWNLYDMLVEYLEHQKIPLGPLLLQDFGVTESVFIHAPHDEYKLSRIEMVLARYPLLRFVLVGDSGQRDPEIYRAVAAKHPGRILAIYIRDVTSDARDLEVRQIAREVTATGTPMIPCLDTAEAARHAASLGLIPTARLAEIIEEKNEDSASG